MCVCVFRVELKEMNVVVVVVVVGGEGPAISARKFVILLNVGRARNVMYLFT